jgi:hypothetical protein
MLSTRVGNCNTSLSLGVRWGTRHNGVQRPILGSRANMLEVSHGL